MAMGVDMLVTLENAGYTSTFENCLLLHLHILSCHYPKQVRTQNRVVIATGLADSTIVLWQSHVAPHDRRSFEARCCVGVRGRIFKNRRFNLQKVEFQ